MQSDSWSHIPMPRVRGGRAVAPRCDEGDGFWSGSLHADRDGRPLLRHRVELGAGSLADDAIDAPRAAINELRYPADSFEDIPIDAGATVLRLADDGILATWQADRLIG